MSLPAGAVWLDAQGAQLNPGRGIARYTTEHTRALLALAPEAIGAVRINPDHPLPAGWDGMRLPRVVAWKARKGAAPPQAPPVYHVMSPFDPVPVDDVWPGWARRSAARTVVTLYDLIPYLLPDQYLDDPRVKAGSVARLGLVRGADHVLALSQVTADDAVDHLGLDSSRITVIDAGVTARLARRVPDAAAAEALLAGRAGLRPRFVLYVGGADRRKNLERLLHGYGRLPEALRERHQLVVSCSLDEHWEGLVRGWAGAAGLRDRDLLLTGYVSDDELAALYRACELFVFPSLYEGFGLPLVEAASCGAPVIASRSSTTAEVLGELSGTFDPYDAAEIGAALERALTRPALLGRLRQRSPRIARRFTWERVAERTLGAYEAVLARPQRPRRRGGRPRLAVFTPWPPQRSGIADYSRRLVAELERLVDVEVVVEGGAEPYEPGAAPLLGERRFPVVERLRPFDRVLYVMGNSVMHAHVYRALLGRPGAVALHDVRLSGFYAPYAELADPADPDAWATAKLRELYGEDAPAANRRELPWSAEHARFYMSGEVQRLATRMLVHSGEARRMLLADRKGEGAPIDVVPFAVPDPPAAAGRAGGADPPPGGEPLVLLSGSLSPAKPLATALAAFARLRRRHPGARLVVAGHGLPAELERWRRLAAELGVGDHVEVLGRVAEERYWQLIRAADLGLQLREVSNGEASAAVADCIAAGLPILVSDIGWYGELPADVAARVGPGCGADEAAAALAALWEDAEGRRRMAAAQRRWAARRSFSAVAERYLEALALA